jgi:hypothetical protein
MLNACQSKKTLFPRAPATIRTRRNARKIAASPEPSVESNRTRTLPALTSVFTNTRERHAISNNRPNGAAVSGSRRYCRAALPEVNTGDRTSPMRQNKTPPGKTGRRFALNTKTTGLLDQRHHRAGEEVVQGATTTVGEGDERFAQRPDEHRARDEPIPGRHIVSGEGRPHEPA